MNKKNRQFRPVICVSAIWFLLLGIALADQVDDDLIASAFVRQFDYVCLIRVKDFKAKEIEIIAIKGDPKGDTKTFLGLAREHLLKVEGKDVISDEALLANQDMNHGKLRRKRSGAGVRDSAGLLFSGIHPNNLWSFKWSLYNVRLDGKVGMEGVVKIDALLRLKGVGKPVPHGPQKKQDRKPETGAK